MARTTAKEPRRGGLLPNVCNNIFYALEARRIRFVCIKLSLGSGGHTIPFRFWSRAAGAAVNIKCHGNHHHTNSHTHMDTGRLALTLGSCKNVSITIQFDNRCTQKPTQAASQPSSHPTALSHRSESHRTHTHKHTHTQGAHKGAESRKVDYKKRKYE